MSTQREYDAAAFDAGMKWVRRAKKRGVPTGEVMAFIAGAKWQRKEQAKAMARAIAKDVR